MSDNYWEVRRVSSWWLVAWFWDGPECFNSVKQDELCKVHCHARYNIQYDFSLSKIESENEPKCVLLPKSYCSMPYFSSQQKLNRAKLYPIHSLVPSIIKPKPFQIHCWFISGVLSRNTDIPIRENWKTL